MDARDLRLAQNWEPRQTKQVTPAANGVSSLTPSTLFPESYSRHMQRVAELKQNGDQHYYVVGIQTRAHLGTNIPTTNLLASASTERGPDKIVERTVDEFATLRNELYSCSKTSHLVKQCAFCSQVARNLRAGILQPGSLLASALPKEKRSRVLCDFLKALLQLAISCPIDVRETCRCQEQASRRLYTFLYGSSTEAEMQPRDRSEC